MIFIRRTRIECERMDIGLHHVTQRGINATMTCEQGLAGKHCRNDAYAKGATSIARAGVAGVLVAFVLDRQFARRQCFDQTGAHALNTFAQGRLAHGNTLRNGRTLTSR